MMHSMTQFFVLWRIQLQRKISVSQFSERGRIFWLAFCASLLFLSGPRGSAATLPPGFVETEIGGDWEGAVGVTFDDTGTMYEWDRDGRVWVFENDARLATPLIDISDEVGNWGDHGLLGFALHPNFRHNGYIYLFYVVDHHHLAKFGTADYN